MKKPTRMRIRGRWMLGGSAWVLAHALHAQPASPAAEPTISHGLFTGVVVIEPTGPVQQFVLLLSDDERPTAADRALAQAMARSGAMVALIPVSPFYRRMEAESQRCAYAAGPLENLAHHIQAFKKLPTYIEPMLAGTGDAAALAYAAAAQGPAGSFASVLSLGFCPRLDQKMPMCAVNGLRWQQAPRGQPGVELQPGGALTAPWLATPVNADAACNAAAQAFVEAVPQATWFPPATSGAAAAARPTPAPAVAPASPPPHDLAAYTRLAARRVALDPPPAQLADLPVIEVPATGTATTGRFAILLSGDGGWAGIDKEIAAALAAKGVPVAGFDSLRYFWTARTPEGLAADLDRLVRYYAARWQRSEVILIGFSQGADVLPFAVNRLPARTRGAVKLTALLGPGQKAAFEFHVTNWLGPSGDKPIAPEAQKLQSADTLCLYGTDDKQSLCPQLAPRHARVVAFSGGHHMGGDYPALAARILEAAGR